MRKRSFTHFLSVLVTMALFTTMIILPYTARAATSPTTRVWIVDDQTPQSGCMLAGAPCPAGQVQVVYIHRVPLMNTLASHRHYILADYNSPQLLKFAQDEALLIREKQLASQVSVARAPGGPAGVPMHVHASPLSTRARHATYRRLATACNQNPNGCTQTDPFYVYVSAIGSSIHMDMSYWVNYDSRMQASSYVLKYIP